MKNKKEQEESSLKDQLNSTQIDTFQSEPTKTFESTNPSQNNNSKLKSQESKDSDPFYGLSFLSFTSVFPTYIIIKAHLFQSKAIQIHTTFF